MHVIRMEARAAQAEALDVFFEEREESDLTAWVDWEAQTVRYEIYVGDAAAVAARVSDVNAALAAAGHGEVVAVASELPDCDWQDAWKSFFHWERVSPRLAVTPPWETPDVSADVSVIRIDPGMSFGTGRHPTTRACLRWLDALATKRAAGAGFCDLGCGSGILAIGAAMLGYRPVVAMDHDPVAVEYAARNLAVNGIEGADVCEADVETWDDPRTFYVVAANMVSRRLALYAEQVTRRVAMEPGAALILAGAMTDQYAEVAAAYEAQGLRELERCEDPPWVSAVFVRS